MEVEDKERVTTALAEIKSGVGGVLTRINEVEVKSQTAMTNMDAKFLDAQKESKDMSEKLATFEGKLITMGEFLRERKMGLGVSLPGLEVEKKKFSLGRVMACMAYIAQDPSCAQSIWKTCGAEFEYEVGQQARKKALDTGTGGAGGGYIVPTEYLVSEFVDLVRANLTVVQAGARVLAGLTGSPVRIPSQLTASTPYWVGQNATITLSNPTFGEASMSPKIMAMRAQISNLEILLSNPDVETLVRNDFAQVAALEIDRVALRGAGTLEPLGLINTPSIPTIAMGTDGANFTFDSMIDFEGTLEDVNTLRGSLAFIFGPKVKRVLKKTRIPQYSGDTAGMYLVPPVMTDRMVGDMMGYPYFTSTMIPTNLTKGSGTDLSEVYFGNWSDMLIGMWGAVEILATNIGGNAWAQNAVEIRLVQNLDVMIRRLASFVIATDVKTV